MPQKRAPRTRLMEVLAIFERAPRPLSARDLSQMMDVGDVTARQYLCRLRSHGCVRFVGGSNRGGRYFERVPGSSPPQDARPLNIAKVRTLRAASRPQAAGAGALDGLRRTLKNAL